MPSSTNPWPHATVALPARDVDQRGRGSSLRPRNLLQRVRAAPRSRSAGCRGKTRETDSGDVDGRYAFHAEAETAEAVRLSHHGVGKGAPCAAAAGVRELRLVTVQFVLDSTVYLRHRSCAPEG